MHPGSEHNHSHPKWLNYSVGGGVEEERRVARGEAGSKRAKGGIRRETVKKSRKYLRGEMRCRGTMERERITGNLNNHTTRSKKERQGKKRGEQTCP